MYICTYNKCYKLIRGKDTILNMKVGVCWFENVSPAAQCECWG